MDVRIIFWLPFFVAGLFIALVGVYTWTRRTVPGAIILFFLSVTASWWCVSEGLLYFGASAATNMLITKFQYVGMVWVAPLALLFVLHLFARRTWSRPRYYLLLFPVPAVILALAWTNDYHGLIWPRYWTINSWSFPMLGLDHGPVFWVSIGYYYICLMGATVVLVRQSFSSAAIFRTQARLILGGMLLPWAGNFIYVAGLSPIPNVDLGPLTFTLLAGIMAWGFFRHHLLDVVPVAMAEVFNSMSDGVIVLDGKGRIIDLNPAAAELVSRPRDLVTGCAAEECLAHLPGVMEKLRGPSQDHGEVTVESPDLSRTYDLRVSPLADHKGRAVGTLLVWRDITDRKKLELELKRLANTDSLTGTLNRGSFLERGNLELTNARRYDRPLSLMMIDLDHFKKINDVYGHQTGDHALRSFAEAVRDELRQGDLFGRMGGEEFAILLSQSDGHSAPVVAERLRQVVSALELDTHRGPLRFTVSIGLTTRVPADLALDSLISRADMALYQSKTQGRNMVMVDSAPINRKPQ